MKPTAGLSPVSCCLMLAFLWQVDLAQAASPSVEQALKLQPVQRTVDVAQPTTQEAAACKISAEKTDGKVGWVVEDANGLTVRRFVDTNGDNIVDQWSYFKNGVEVYRDIDSDFDGKADQYRWFHTSGSRWGLDKNQDGEIDAWKTISAEEVTAEAVAALAARDPGRFGRLLLTREELDSLGLGQEKAKSVAEKLARAATAFKTLAAQQKSVTADSKWVQFSGTLPGIVPAGTGGSTKDLWAYENVVAIVESGESHGEVQIGTLVRVDDRWRMIDLPQVGAEGQADAAPAGIFFQTSLVNRSTPNGDGRSGTGQELLAELESLDRQADQATTPDEQAKSNARRADLLEKIAKQAQTPEDRALWIRQLADMVSAAVQSGTFPEGVQRLETLFKELNGAGGDANLSAYVKFRHMTAAYGLSIQTPNADFAKIQGQWLKDLEQYVADYPNAPDTAEAMLQLAIAQEFAAQEDAAKQWYDRIVKAFPQSPAGQKAAGSLTRLDCVGKTIALTGKTPAGGTVDLSKYRGSVVLVQYWATSSARAKADMPALKELAAKYGKSLSIIGVNLDSRAEDLTAYLTENRLPWPQIFEEGGLDSRPANQLGILALPTMILVDQQGKVIDRNVQMTDLDAQLKKLIR